MHFKVVNFVLHEFYLIKKKWWKAFFVDGLQSQAVAGFGLRAVVCQPLA